MSENDNNIMDENISVDDTPSQSISNELFEAKYSNIITEQQAQKKTLEDVSKNVVDLTKSITEISQNLSSFTQKTNMDNNEIDKKELPIVPSPQLPNINSSSVGKMTFDTELNQFKNLQSKIEQTIYEPIKQEYQEALDGYKAFWAQERYFKEEDNKILAPEAIVDFDTLSSSFRAEEERRVSIALKQREYEKKMNHLKNKAKVASQCMDAALNKGPGQVEYYLTLLKNFDKHYYN